MSKLPVPQDYKAAAEELEREAAEAEAERDFTESVIRRKIDWNVYSNNGDITKKEQGLLLDYDTDVIEEQNDLLNEKGLHYAQLFVKCVDKLRSRDAVEYLIVVIYQLLQRDEQRAQYFHRTNKQNNTEIYAPFLRILTSSDAYNPFTLHTASSILAILFSTANHVPPTNPYLRNYIRYLSSRVSSAIGRDLLVVLNEVKTLVRGISAQSCWISEGAIQSLSTLLHRDTQNAQLIYLVGFSFWLLSYNAESSKPMQELQVIKKFVQIVKANVMEKVVRISYAIFRNLVELGDSSIVEELIGHGLVGLTDTLQKRKFKDNDLMQDMEVVTRFLQESIQKLSTFEIYQSEVMSGSLKESPVHTNEAFWRENISQFESNNFRIVAKLVAIAKDVSETAEVREVAAWDLGEFSRFHPDGRRIVTLLGGKTALMILMTEKNVRLAKAALLATQKIMVSNWEFLQKSSAAGVQSLVTNKK